jgi:hypothetical protein
VDVGCVVYGFGEDVGVWAGVGGWVGMHAYPAARHQALPLTVLSHSIVRSTNHNRAKPGNKLKIKYNIIIYE